MSALFALPATTARPSHLIRVAVPRLNKCDHIHEYLKQIEARDYDLEWAQVDETRTLSSAEWNEFVTSLLNDRDWLAEKGGTSSWTGKALNGRDDIIGMSKEQMDEWRRGAYLHVVEVVAPTGQKLYIDPQGYNYARYVGFPAEGMPEPKTREEIRREEAQAREAGRVAELKQRIDNPAAVPPEHGLKFFWNGFKVNGGKLFGCNYSAGELVHYPAGTITVYAHDYNRFPGQFSKYFHVENNTEIQSDYFDDDKVRVTPNHPLHAAVKTALDAQEQHHNAVVEKREAKYRRSM